MNAIKVALFFALLGNQAAWANTCSSVFSQSLPAKISLQEKSIELAVKGDTRRAIEVEKHIKSILQFGEVVGELKNANTNTSSNVFLVTLKDPSTGTQYEAYAKYNDFLNPHTEVVSYEIDRDLGFFVRPVIAIREFNDPKTGEAKQMSITLAITEQKLTTREQHQAALSELKNYHYSYWLAKFLAHLTNDKDTNTRNIPPAPLLNNRAIYLDAGESMRGLGAFDSAYPVLLQNFDINFRQYLPVYYRVKKLFTDEYIKEKVLKSYGFKSEDEIGTKYLVMNRDYQYLKNNLSDFFYYFQLYVPELRTKDFREREGLTFMESFPDAFKAPGS